MSNNRKTLGHNRRLLTHLPFPMLHYTYEQMNRLRRVTHHDMLDNPKTPVHSSLSRITIYRALLAGRILQSMS